MAVTGNLAPSRRVTAALVAALTAMAAVALGVASFSGFSGEDDASLEVSAGEQTTEGQTLATEARVDELDVWVPEEPAAYLSFDGEKPAAPEAPLALGPLVLDGPLDVATDLLGPAHSVSPDLSGWLHEWQLGDGATLGVTMWADDTFQIAGLHASVPEDSAVRFGLPGGAVLGSSTVGEIAETVGEVRLATHEHDDFIAMAVRCSGPFPVVLKYDAPGPRPADDMLDRQATRVLIGYADAAPGSPPCG